MFEIVVISVYKNNVWLILNHNVAKPTIMFQPTIQYQLRPITQTTTTTCLTNYHHLTRIRCVFTEVNDILINQQCCGSKTNTHQNLHKNWYLVIHIYWHVRYFIQRSTFDHICWLGCWKKQLKKIQTLPKYTSNI